MQLIEITRYPVKSLQGERVTVATIEADGLVGDRCWGIRDEITGKVLTARRAPELLFASAMLAPNGAPVITLPTGERCQGPGADTDAALSRWLARPVRLVRSVGEPGARAEFFADPTDDSSEALEWTMPAGRFVDALPLLVLTTASLRTGAALHADGDWQVRRFRANLLLDVEGDGWGEDEWYASSDLRIGDVRLQPQEGCIRCTMVTRPQPGLPEDRDLFRVLARHHDARFGAWTSVAVGGTLRVGDDVYAEPRGPVTHDQEPLVVTQRRSDNEPQPVDIA